MNSPGAWLGGQRFELPVTYASWKERDGTTRQWVRYAHCFDAAWPWWFPATDAELLLSSAQIL
jgi:hypothetical protein